MTHAHTDAMSLGRDFTTARSAKIRTAQDGWTDVVLIWDDGATAPISFTRIDSALDYCRSLGFEVI